MNADPQIETIRKYFAAYETKDRRAIEALLSPEFTFSSPFTTNFHRGERAVMMAAADAYFLVS